MSASLYVGDLDPDVGESLLFDIFKQVGPVASIRVCRDAVTRRSLGYAYVNFHNLSDAERALDTLNYSNIKTRPCRIMWSHRDPSIRRSGVGNIFIKNLDKAIDNKALYDTFSTFGNILSCKVVTDEHGNSKGYGFVHYETQEAADLAIVNVNNMLLNDTLVFVGPFIPRKDRRSVNPNETFTNVYVKLLDESWDDAKIREIFAKYGEIDSAVVMRDAEGKSKGFGFVNFKDHAAASAAVQAIPNEKFEGDRVLFVDRAQKKAEREQRLREQYRKNREKRLQTYQGVNLYIKNLDDTVDEERLRSEFSSFGTITSVKIMVDEKAVSRGFGFVCFSKPEEASKAVAEMNSKMIINKPIYVALAQPKEVRRAQLEASYSQRQSLRMQQAMPMGTVPAMFPGGAQPFYPPAGMPAGGRQYVYPQAMMPGQVGPRRWTGQPGARPQQFQQMPNYQMQQGQRAPRGQGGPRGGRGGAVAGVPGAGMVPGGMVPGARVQGGGARRGGKYPGSPSGAPAGQRRDVMIPPGAQMVPVPVQAYVQPVIDAPAETLSYRLARASPDERRQILGDNLFPLIHQREQTHAAKITGMILESTEDYGELLRLLDDPSALNEKIQEAFNVLKLHLAAENGENPAGASA